MREKLYMAISMYEFRKMARTVIFKKDVTLCVKKCTSSTAYVLFEYQCYVNDVKSSRTQTFEVHTNEIQTRYERNRNSNLRTNDISLPLNGPGEFSSRAAM